MVIVSLSLSKSGKALNRFVEHTVNLLCKTRGIAQSPLPELLAFLVADVTIPFAQDITTENGVEIEKIVSETCAAHSQ